MTSAARRPLILGHEAAGMALSGRLEGYRVTVNPLATRGDYDACVAGRNNLCPLRQIISMPAREGAFAERLAIPERNLVDVPDGVAIEHAALAKPLACGGAGNAGSEPPAGGGRAVQGL